MAEPQTEMEAGPNSRYTRGSMRLCELNVVQLVTNLRSRPTGTRTGGHSSYPLIAL